MYNFNICTVVCLMLVGCGTPMGVDAGVVAPDAEVQDGGSDGGQDGATDAQDDAAVPDGGADAGDSGSTEDAGSEDHDAAADAGGSDASTDASIPDAEVGRGVPIEIGVNGDGSCLLTDRNGMWCWGYGNIIPTYIADAVELEGTCAIAVDGHVFCWGYGGITDVVGTDAAVLGSLAYTSRTDGIVYGLGFAVSWVPPIAVEAMPAQFCAIDVDGGLTCWDWLTSPSRFGSFWNAVPGSATYNVTDVARRGSLTIGDSVICYAWTGMMPTASPGSFRSGPDIECQNLSGVIGSMFTKGTEIEMANARACSIVTVASDLGDHPVGVYCTSDLMGPLPTSEMYMNSYTDIVGTDLALGQNHICIMQGSDIRCWGDNARGQLGNGSTISSSAPQSVVW